jgi:hypothetical protein
MKDSRTLRRVLRAVKTGLLRVNLKDMKLKLAAGLMLFGALFNRPLNGIVNLSGNLGGDCPDYIFSF